MKTRKLGYTDMEFTVIGMGTWAIGGGDNPYGWGPQDDRDSIAAIQQAIDLGVNWLDTAKGYGHGHSEEVVGQAIKGRRDQVAVATKCGILWKEDGSDIYGHLKADSIKRECESSLKRLGVDVIDLYQIHWPLPDEGIEEGWGAIADLIQEGKVRHGGVSNFSVEQLERIKDIHPIASLQPPYSLLERGVETNTLDYCRQNNIGVIVYSPMQAGLLTGKMTKERVAAMPADDWRRGAPHFQEPALSINLELVERLRTIAEKHNRPIPHVAIAWVLRRPEVTGAIVGGRTAAQVAENARAADFVLPEEDIVAIDELLHKRAEQLAKAEV
jgi:aryl-alcohol dehydrogenase-like predicted oxidoreductase